MDSCHYCGGTEQLRPYGPGGKPICFPCMKDSPDREAEAGQHFEARTAMAEAADPKGMAVLTEDAPPVSATALLQGVEFDDSPPAILPPCDPVASKTEISPYNPDGQLGDRLLWLLAEALDLMSGHTDTWLVGVDPNRGDRWAAIMGDVARETAQVTSPRPDTIEVPLFSWASITVLRNDHMQPCTMIVSADVFESIQDAATEAESDLARYEDDVEVPNVG